MNLDIKILDKNSLKTVVYAMPGEGKLLNYCTSLIRISKSLDIYYAVFVDDKPAARCIVTLKGKEKRLFKHKQAYMSSLFVLPDYRNHKIAYRLVQKVMADLKQSGYHSVCVLVESNNLYACMLYTSLGFNISESIDLGSVYMHIMSVEL